MWAANATAAIDIPLGDTVIKAGTQVTVTRGRTEKYALWATCGIYDLPAFYVKNVTTFCKSSKSEKKQLIRKRMSNLIKKCLS